MIVVAVQCDQPPSRPRLLFGSAAAQEEHVYERGAEEDHESPRENTGERDSCEWGRSDKGTK